MGDDLRVVVPMVSCGAFTERFADAEILMPLRTDTCVRVATLAMLVTCADSWLFTWSVRAAPPTPRVVAATLSLPSNAQWINHEVVFGESLNEIAERYAVSVGSILRWNKLDPNRPQFWVGEQLRVLTQLPGRQRNKFSYVVRTNDSWVSVAERFQVDQSALRRNWNPKEKKLTPGRQLTIWVEPDVTPDLPVPKFTLKPVADGAVSVGFPDNGRLLAGVPIPDNPELYTIRNVEHAYGSTHAIGVLQQAIATFRVRTGYDQPIYLWDMSMRSGGRYGPHRSHRSGRDIDIGLPLQAQVKGKPVPVAGQAAQKSVDWTALWHMVRAFIETGEVRYVFLSRIQQSNLYRAAKACGATNEELEHWLQYPRFKKLGVVRDAPGHTGHLHVRFLCGPDELDSCKER